MALKLNLNAEFDSFAAAKSWHWVQHLQQHYYFGLRAAP
jgi:hypothetical protein